ncbi:MAG: phosphoglucosamine mutase [Deltaproteobacteria bacterium]|nr:phosphoglucosamine mutase [Deltaproteobacteria bacterium]
MTTHKRKLFGTDGIRGEANRAPMTSEMALNLGRALTLALKRSGGRKSPRIVVGKDTRLSGYMLETAMASGICSMGGTVMLVGPLPTPGISFITSSMRADAGVVISASHNPYHDNGIKLFGHDGFKLPDAEEAAIEDLMESPKLMGRAPGGGGIGQAVRIDDALGRYVVELKHTFPSDLTLDGMKVVVDCANGAAYRTAPLVFGELGAQVRAIGVSPNGRNINSRCGSLHPEHAGREVARIGADMGVALDGDADRVILLDEKGDVVDGDAVMALCATRMLRGKRLARRTLVTTVMSNMGLDNAVRAAGGKVVRTQVGDRYVVEAMREGGYIVGGEQSGHLIFLDHASTGDGIVAALQIQAIMVRERRPLSELAKEVMARVPQVLVNSEVSRKIPLETLSDVQKTIRKVEKALGADGRVLVRYSGTENKVRVLVEGPDEAASGRFAAEITDSLKRALAG